MVAARYCRSWRGLRSRRRSGRTSRCAAFAPAGTPPAIVATLNAAIEKSLADPNLAANFVKGSLESGGGTPEKLSALAKADSVKYARLVKELNISAT